MHDPTFADIYRADPTKIFGGDAHMEASRPCAVVTVDDVTVRVLGRSTRPVLTGDDVLRSPVEPSCGLDKDGHFAERYQHVLFRKDFAPVPHHVFLGPLPEARAAELRTYWERISGF